MAENTFQHTADSTNSQNGKRAGIDRCPRCYSADPKRLLFACTVYGKLDPWHFQVVLDKESHGEKGSEE